MARTVHYSIYLNYFTAGFSAAHVSRRKSHHGCYARAVSLLYVRWLISRSAPPRRRSQAHARPPPCTSRLGHDDVILSLYAAFLILKLVIPNGSRLGCHSVYLSSPTAVPRHFFFRDEMRIEFLIDGMIHANEKMRVRIAKHRFIAACCALP